MTFVTEKNLGNYDIKPWAADPPLGRPDPGYSVIELYLDARGRGEGALSLASEVRVDVVKHKAFVSHATGTDLYAAIDSCVDKAQRQIKDFKDQLKAH